jgi:hypothetical protein
MADLLRQLAAPPRNAWVRLCYWLFRGLVFIWATVVLGLALNVSATWLTTKGFNSTGTPLGWIIQHLSIALTCGGILLVLTILSGVLGRQDESVDSHILLSPPAEENRRVLIHLLRKEYNKQVTASLGEVTKIAVALQWRRDVTPSSVSSVSWRMEAPDGHASSALASIVQVYDDAGAGLLILGAPGAGKSMLLGELASELLTRAEDDTTMPIPVNVNLSSWASKKAPLMAWMVGQLGETYHIPRRLSQALIAHNQLLFLLDGLDEVERSARTKCIEAINAYLAEQDRIVPIVVCARSYAYLEQEERLRLPDAVEVQPLTPQQVNDYLTRAGKPMSAVRSALRRNAVLRELITTPLMLRVVMLAYRGKTVNDLPQLGTAAEQQRQVFEHYEKRMLEQKREWRYRASQTHQWLIWLARQMEQHHLTEFYLERLQPTWLLTKRSQTTFSFLFRLFSGLLYGLVWGLAVGLAFSLFNGLLVGLGVGLYSGLQLGLLSGLIGTESQEIHPKDVVSSAKNEFWSRIVIAMVLGLALGLILGLGVGLFVELFGGSSIRFLITVSNRLISVLLSALIAGLIMGLLYGLVWGLAFMIRDGLPRQQMTENLRIKPNQRIQSSGWSALYVGFMIMLIVGLLSGLFFGLAFGLLNGLLSGLAFGLLGGLLSGLNFGGNAYLQHYLLRYLLWRSGAIPWHYVRFLEEATERILLQRVGGGYRFIHPLFQEYFASLGTGTPASIQLRSSSPQP